MSSQAVVQLGSRVSAAASPGPARPVSTEQLLIGKDIVELLSTAMYVEPISIYREYVQNAADSIDEAARCGLLSDAGAGRIEITLDPVERSARVRDNGVGVPAGEAERVLTAFGASRKRGLPAGQARGFRGVGRLAALGYAQAVTFRTKAAGEIRGTEVRWDCRRLRAILLDPSYNGNLSDVVVEVVTVRQGAQEAADAHYFEVHLEKVIRLKGDALLNEKEVSDYLAQVAPVPFSDDFKFGPEIEEFLSPYLPFGSYDVRVNGAAPLVRPFRDELAVTQTKTDRFVQLERITLEDPDVGVIALGWILHHNYLGAIQASPEVAGLRARIGNIQIGGSDIFLEIFPESRFNAWTVGEVHVLDPRVLPNGRRDNLERTTTSSTLVHRLYPYGRDVARHCRTSSTHRVKLKRFAVAEERSCELLNILEQGAVGREAAASLRREVGSLFGEMEKLARGLALDSVAAELQDRLAQLRIRFDAFIQRPADAGTVAGPLGRIPEERREAFTWAVDLIYGCAVNRGAAKALVDRMMARIAGTVE